ncbi:MAG: hypothetical protein ABGZ17_26210 [Planctomycetaceae bacterium]
MHRNQLTNRVLSRISSDLAMTICLVTVVCFVSGCGEDPPYGGPRLEIVPITGIVKVDGEHMEGVGLEFVPADPRGLDFSVPRPHAVTDENGVITASTYVTNDGAVPGEYIVLFFAYGASSRVDPLTGDESGKDIFQGRYIRPDTSPFRATVPDQLDGGEPFDIGTYEWSTESG